MSTKQLPLVSIILPCRNEEAFLTACLDSLMASDYPAEKIEIILVDGQSTDGTLAIAGTYESLANTVKLSIVDNPRKIFPCAVNLGVQHAKGDYLMIVGAHAVYSVSYISSTIEAALRTGADNTGGVLITEGLNRSLMGKAITYVLSSSFGVGNSTFRTGSKVETEVDTVFGGCYKKSVFEKIGLFNEHLVSTSDMDFNTRLKRAGGKIVLTPAATATYYTRTDFKKFIRNNYRNGFWSLYPLRFLNYLPVRFRHLIPLFFFCGLLLGIALSCVWNLMLFVFAGCLAFYFLIATLASLKFVRHHFLNLFLMPVLFFLLHTTYGLGSLVGVVRLVWERVFRGSVEKEVTER